MILNAYVNITNDMNISIEQKLINTLDNLSINNSTENDNSIDEYDDVKVDQEYVILEILYYNDSDDVNIVIVNEFDSYLTLRIPDSHKISRINSSLKILSFRKIDEGNYIVKIDI